MDAKWEKVYTTDKPYQAEFLRSLLEEGGIRSFVIDKRDTSYLFGELEIYVPQFDATEAKIIITENDL